MSDNVIDLFQRKKKPASSERTAQQENNERVLEKLEQGDDLATSTLEDTWFPPKGVFDREKGRMVPVREKND